jgi:hypothetical protein
MLSQLTYTMSQQHSIKNWIFVPGLRVLVPEWAFTTDFSWENTSWKANHQLYLVFFSPVRLFEGKLAEEPRRRNIRCYAWSDTNNKVNTAEKKKFIVSAICCVAGY